MSLMKASSYFLATILGILAAGFWWMLMSGRTPYHSLLVTVILAVACSWGTIYYLIDARHQR